MITFLEPQLKIRIFDYLSDEELRIAATVCENWRDVICSSRKLMGKYQYNIQNYNNQKVFISFFGGFLPKIRVQGSFKSIKMFKEMLSRIHHVKELEFHDIDLRSRPKKYFYTDINLPVKHLKLVGMSNSWKITNFLNSADLRSLELVVIENISAYNYGYFGKLFIEWLIKRKRLESLTLVSSFC